MKRAAPSPSRFRFGGLVRHHYSGGPGGGAIASVPNFAPAELCRELVARCEAAGGFEAEAPAGSPGDAAAPRYEQATTDLEVDSPRASAVRALLLQSGLVREVSRAMRATHGGVSPTAFDDVFVVRYEAAAAAAAAAAGSGAEVGGAPQRSLVRHVDGADVSFMLALSARGGGGGGGEDYEGGGTAFDVLGGTTTTTTTEEEQPGASPVLHLAQGELVIFDAALYHAGLPITRGRRHLLVGFCHVARPAAARERGGLGLNLARLRGSCSPFGVWSWQPAQQEPAQQQQQQQQQGALSGEQQRAPKQRRLHEERAAPPLGDATALLRAARQMADQQQAAPAWVRCGSGDDDGGGAAGGGVAADGTALLAEFARRVFWFHVRRLGCRTAPEGGAEYWVQRLHLPPQRRNRGPEGQQQQQQQEEEEEED